jgi:protein-export membrane protein SecD
LLEINSDSLIEEKIQSKVIPIKKLLKDNGINYNDFKIINKNLFLTLDNINKFDLLFYSRKDNLVNPYIDNYRSYELEYKKINNQKIEISFSKFGLLTINNSALKQSIEIVRRRIDDVGTKEPTILQRGEKRILVELPGLKDPERIKALLGKTAQLNFRLVSENNNEFGVEELISENGEKLNISKRIIMSGENLIDAQPSIQNQNNEPTVSFTLDRVGSQKFGRATTDNVGKRLAIVLDGEIVSAPNINEPITSGNGMISGNFTFQEATDLSLLLRSGALPTPLLVVEERTVGPDLGEDSIKSGITSLIVGFILVIAFMLYKYRVFGLIANAALIANLLMLVGVLTILEATLTLPGIAGIILTVGMAVDANVLIFERIREELKTEKSIIHAFDTGYTRAKITVLDANITTLIAAVILFAFGSGPVKGFAITLGIGIVTTLFTAYFLARHLTSLIVLNTKNKEIKI